MKARMPGGYGRPDMSSLMRQAQKMQSDMQAKQAELEQTEYTASAPGEIRVHRQRPRRDGHGADERQARGAGSDHQARSCGPR